MRKDFDNKDRNRFYGIRVGDIVQDIFVPKIKGEVIAYTGDNNRVIILIEGDEAIEEREYGAVASILKILKKVEEK